MAATGDRGQDGLGISKFQWVRHSDEQGEHGVQRGVGGNPIERNSAEMRLRV
jgi:hypothetical protein